MEFPRQGTSAHFGNTFIFMAIILLPVDSRSSEPTGADSSARIPVAAMWDFTDLYPSPSAWIDAYNNAKSSAEKLPKYKGTLGADANSLFIALDDFATTHSVGWRNCGLLCTDQHKP
jgi:hypothetical protein